MTARTMKLWGSTILACYGFCMMGEGLFWLWCIGLTMMSLGLWLIHQIGGQP